jgi:tRNA U34 5-methylaminomethyl-2-thiouridine-forming methyltransferase MnmC
MHVLTADGSSTLFSEKYGECYHSRHGAVQESRHVFLQMGLHALPPDLREIRILEMGLGTGLNALLTCLEASDRQIHYLGLEAEPVAPALFPQLNYGDQIPAEKAQPTLEAILQAPWEEAISLSPTFTLEKRQVRIQDFEPGTDQQFDLIYYDAFAPDAQPELWSEELFQKLFSWAAPGAFLTTYSAKGAVRRAMIAAGFSVEKLPGPPGKREMLRAHKA